MLPIVSIGGNDFILSARSSFQLATVLATH
jgi:hypothetical protein